MLASTHEVTRLLAEASAGHKSAAEALFPLIYDELRALAGSFFRGERPDHTLQPTALVHEAYLRLVDPASVQARDRGQFFALASQVMRRVLVDHARRRDAEKRGGGQTRIALDDAVTPAPQRELDVLAVEDCLQQLSALNERTARVVELRFFGGLTVEETAEAIEVSPETVAREWRFARAWLKDRLR